MQAQVLRQECATPIMTICSYILEKRRKYQGLFKSRRYMTVKAPLLETGTNLSLSLL